VDPHTAGVNAVTATLSLDIKTTLRKRSLDVKIFLLDVERSP